MGHAHGDRHENRNGPDRNDGHTVSSKASYQGRPGNGDARPGLTRTSHPGGRSRVGDSYNDREYAWLGEDPDASVRAAKLDESLDILSGLWSGERFEYSGRFNRVRESTFLPTPVQRPRIPVWVGGTWPGKRPMRRAARFDGAIPAKADFYEGGFLAPSEVSETLAYIREHRTTEGPFDFAFIAGYPDNQPDPRGDEFERYVEAGVTWWLLHATDLEDARSKANSGPPRRY